MSDSFAHQASRLIKQRYPDFHPRVAIVLGSGLGGFADALNNKQVIDYQELPGFPKVGVHGHNGQLVLGYLGNTAVICLQGRAHAYEGNTQEQVKTYVRTMKLLGCEYYIATNAAGSLNLEAGPGELMLIHDHINLQPGNPLAGPNDDEFGPRFFPVDNAYDHALRQIMLKAAAKEKVTLHQGVYIAVLGPNYETAAEIRAFKIMGADAVGMSTVPEVLVANHCGLKAGVISIITNYATGLSQESHNHDAVVKMAESAAGKLVKILQQTVQDLS